MVEEHYIFRIFLKIDILARPAVFVFYPVVPLPAGGISSYLQHSHSTELH